MIRPRWPGGSPEPPGLRVCPDLHPSRGAPAVSQDDIETRYCQYVEEVLNHHHLDGLAAYLNPDVVVHAPGVASGLAGAQQLLASYFSAFPDLHLTIDTLLAMDGE